jgi:glycine/D-amino acid oxidase-like deaminating enzyme
MPKLSRRSLFLALPGASTLRALAGPRGGLMPAVDRRRGAAGAQRPSVVVVGAGAFGGWTALSLLRRGAKVTLVDTWGPGNSRASSGGETRVIRAIYGSDGIYVAMVARAFELWRENEKRWKRTLYRRTGALWMAAGPGEYVRSSIPFLREKGFQFEEISAAEASKRYPQMRFEGLDWALYEKEAGYLLARQACAQVLEGFLAEGGSYREAASSPGGIANGRMRAVALSDGTELSADAYVFACGPWLGKLFPEILGGFLEPTRQEVFYFGTPAGDLRFSEDHLPLWIEVPRFWYGIPGNQWRGFKVADDTRGAVFDPTSGDRLASTEGLKAARDYMAMRFPGLAGAPLLESRVCQYENSPDHHFLVDHHPEAANVWLVGGGSGHGFKHGPAMGELVAGNVLEEKPPEPLFSLRRPRQRV